MLQTNLPQSWKVDSIHSTYTRRDYHKYCPLLCNWSDRLILKTNFNRNGKTFVLESLFSKINVLNITKLSILVLLQKIPWKLKSWHIHSTTRRDYHTHCTLAYSIMWSDRLILKTNFNRIGKALIVIVIQNSVNWN